MKNKIPLFREFPFSGTTNELMRNTFVAVGYNKLSEEALVTLYFSTVTSHFDYSLRQRASSLEKPASLSVDCGNLTRDHQLV